MSERKPRRILQVKRPADTRGRYVNLDLHPVSEVRWGVVLRELHLYKGEPKSRGTLASGETNYNVHRKPVSRVDSKFVQLLGARQQTEAWLQPRSGFARLRVSLKMHLRRHGNANLRASWTS